MNDDAAIRPSAFRLWVSGQPVSVARSIARALELALDHTGATVVLSARRPAADARAGHPRLIEVVVGDVPVDTGSVDDPRPTAPAPDVVVPGDGARAGESAQLVLRHLAAAGYSEPVEEYSDDDEAAVSVRLKAFGYL